MTELDQAQAAADKLKAELEELGLAARVHLLVRPRTWDVPVVVAVELDATAALQLVTRLRTRDTGARRRKDDSHPSGDG